MLLLRCRESLLVTVSVFKLRSYRDPRDYLKHVMKATNMSCLTPEGATSGDCDFLSANMYARSLFGE
jgi:vesicle coat complex subunit